MGCMRCAPDAEVEAYGQRLGDACSEADMMVRQRCRRRGWACTPGVRRRPGRRPAGCRAIPPTGAARIVRARAVTQEPKDYEREARIFYPVIIQVTHHQKIGSAGMDMAPKPKGLAPEYGAQFRDESVADAYPTRPPYPTEVFDVLAGLARDEPRTVLDLGCGTGDIARPLAPRVSRVDAVDPSPAMLAGGRALPCGDHPHLHWIRASAEEFDYPAPFALVVAAESLHWMDWGVVLPRIGRALSPRGRLALVVGRGFIDVPWAANLRPLIDAYSTNRDFAPYDLVGELTGRGLFAVEGHLQTAPVPFAQPVAAYVESWHSRNGFSRERMGARAAEFDTQLTALVRPFAVADWLSFRLVADIVWGHPQRG